MDRVDDLSGRPGAELWARSWTCAPGRLVIGIGNIKGIGNELLAICVPGEPLEVA